MLAVPSCGTTLVSMVSVPLVVIGPPFSPSPVPTLVTVPAPAEAQAHALPLHCNTCFVVQVVSRLRFNVPLAPPPVRPEPLAVVIPVIVPVPGKVCPVANVMRPLLAIFSPVSDGLVAPSPNSRFKVPEGELVSLPAGSDCH